MSTSTENGTLFTSATVSENDYRLKIFQSSLNLLTHILIGIIVGVALLFAFREGLPTGATPIHVVLCVLGYQLLMAQAILSLSPSNGWSAKLKLVDKRRAHWILQVAGSGLAIAGSFIKILDKENHWNTYHGQFALVALVFTTVSLVNGLASLWSYEIQRAVRLPPKISKLTHICFGIVGFSAACITLCYGFDKGSIRGWIGNGLSNTLITFTACLVFIIIIDPLIRFGKKLIGN